MKKWKDKDKRSGETVWRARFEINKKTFRPKAETKDKLDKLIREIQNQEEIEQANKKYNLNLNEFSFVPTLAEVLENSFQYIEKPHQKKIAERVFEDFQNLLPPLKVDELQKRHFQLYIDFRTIGKTKKSVKIQTVYKELYAIRTALKRVPIEYEKLENWQIPSLPPMPSGTKKKAQRQRLIEDRESDLIIENLLNDPKGKKTKHQTFARIRLAHFFAFQLETGLRRKEVARLKFSQFDETAAALRNVRRWKTGTVTKYLPLSVRAVEIIAERRELQGENEFIFSPSGEPNEADYRILRKVCKDLKIPYGRNIDGGFILHDSRHNVATEIMQKTDIETARELLGHSNINQTATYVHTNAERLREAVRKRSKTDYLGELEKVFEMVKNQEMGKENFIEKMRKMIGF